VIKIFEDILLLEKVFLNEPFCRELDECFQNILDERKFNSSLKKINQIIKREFNIACEIKVEEYNSQSEIMYGMKVMPSKEMLNECAKVFLDREGKYRYPNLVSGFLIIEGNLINYLRGQSLHNSKKVENANKILTGILLHEIGHFFHLLNDILYYKAEFWKKWGLVIGTTTATISTGSFLIPIAVIFVMYIYNSKVKLFKNKQAELFADSLSAKYGYAVYITEFLRIGYGEVIKPDEKVKFNLIKDWFYKNFTHFGVRKTMILETLRGELKEAETDYERKILEEQIKLLERKFY
jgi:predicted Zn-dependent protease with MMP-like domain